MNKVIGFKEAGELKLYITRYTKHMNEFIAYLASTEDPDTRLEFVINQTILSTHAVPVLSDEDVAHRYYDKTVKEQVS